MTQSRMSYATRRMLHARTGVLPAEDQLVVRRSASQATTKRAVARMLGRCLEYEQTVAGRAPRATDAYGLALCACWRRELLRRMRQIDQEARDAVRWA